MAQHDITAVLQYKRNSLPGPTAPLPIAILDLYTKIVPGTESYEWNFTRRIDNHSDTGDQCASYGKGHKRARGQTWVDVWEAMDFYTGADSMPLYAGEIDYFGPRGRKTTGAAILAVVGRATDTPYRDPNDMGVAHLPGILHVVPYYYDWGKVKLDYVIRSEMKCEQAIIQMQGGDRIRLSDDPAVPEIGFDPHTGFAGLWRGRLCVAGIHVTTYETCIAREFPLPAGFIRFSDPRFPLHRLIGGPRPTPKGGTMPLGDGERNDWFKDIIKIMAGFAFGMMALLALIMGGCLDRLADRLDPPPAASQQPSK